MADESMSTISSGGDSPALLLFYEGRRLMESGDFASAVGAFRQSADSMPHYKTLQLLGDCLLRLGHAKEAVIPLAAATGLNRQPLAPVLLAEALMAIGDFNGAESAAQNAYERAPDYRRAKAVLERASEVRRTALREFGLDDC